MARSVSRSRKTASKSPARVRKQITPKSEPNKSTASKADPRKMSTSKAHSRSRSASRGRGAKNQKSSSKSASISKLHSRDLTALHIDMAPVKTTPKRVDLKKTHSPTKPAVIKKTMPSKSPAMKRHASKTSPVASPASKPSSMKSPSRNTFTSSIERASRSYERKLFTPASMEPEIRQRFLRQQSYSRSPTQVKIKRPVTSFFSSLYNRFCGAACSAGQCICCSTRAVCNMIIVNRREILVTILILLLVALTSYFVLYTDPAKTRAFIQSIPSNVHKWYQKNFGRK